MINIRNIDDNECFKRYLVRYLHPADHHPDRVTKADKDFERKYDFKNIKFPVEIRDIHKIFKNCSTTISVFPYKNMEKYSIYVSKN